MFGLFFYSLGSDNDAKKAVRDNLNLSRSIDVPLFTAILGGKCYFDHFGKRMEVNIAENSDGTKRLRLQGLGITKNKQTGNLFLSLNIIVPKNLAARKKQLMDEFIKIEESKLKKWIKPILGLYSLYSSPSLYLLLSFSKYNCTSLLKLIS